MSHVAEEQLVAFYFGDTEGDEAAEIERHLHECDACQRAFAEVQRTLSAVGSLPVPERSESYGTEVWLRIQPEIARLRTPSWSERISAWFVPHRLAFAGGLAVMVLAAFVAGRFWPTNTPTTVATNTSGANHASVADHTPEEVRQRVLLTAVGDHLERSQVTLSELVNAGGNEPVDITTEQERARDLVAANRLFRQTAEAAGEKGVASVLDDLERVLVEVANGPSTLTPRDVEKVRDRIDSQGLLFKVRILGERVRDDLKPPASKPARDTKGA